MKLELKNGSTLNVLRDGTVLCTRIDEATERRVCSRLVCAWFNAKINPPEYEGWYLVRSLQPKYRDLVQTLYWNGAAWELPGGSQGHRINTSLHLGWHEWCGVHEDHAKEFGTYLPMDSNPFAIYMPRILSKHPDLAGYEIDMMAISIDELDAMPHELEEKARAIEEAEDYHRDAAWTEAIGRSTIYCVAPDGYLFARLVKKEMPTVLCLVAKINS